MYPVKVGKDKDRPVVFQDRVVLLYTYPGYLSYSTKLSPPWYSGKGIVGNLDVVPSFPYPTPLYPT